MKPSEEEIRKGVDLCFDNANGLIDDAETLFREESYGHASFLAFSAIEEVCKAYMYALNRTDIWKSEELKTDVVRHDSKLAIYLFSLLADIVQKKIEKGDIRMAKPLDIEDLAEMSKDIDSIMGDLWNTRNQSLYVDRVNEKWLTPHDTKRIDAEFLIESAKKTRREMRRLCEDMLNVPIEPAKKISEYIEKELFPWLEEQFYKNAEEFYKRNMITKRLYETILKREKEKKMGIY